MTLGRLTHSLNFHFLGVTSWGFLYKDAELELGLQGIYEESIPADRGSGGMRDGQRERLNCNQVSAKSPWGSLQQTCSVRVGSYWLGCSGLYPPAWAHHLCRQSRMYITLKKRLTAGGSLLTALPPLGRQAFPSRWIWQCICAPTILACRRKIIIGPILCCCDNDIS